MIKFIKALNAKRRAHRRLRRSITGEKCKSIRFPAQAKNVKKILSEAVPNGRTAIFALFSRDGYIKESTLYYISHLSEITDNVVVIGDCPILPNEILRLPNIVRYCSFKRHCKYDFGSYKLGYEYVMRNPALATSTELLFCNDSCYAPVVPFKNVFEKMASVSCDFWGLCQNWHGLWHIQSYFLVLKRNVFTSKCFASFMRGVKKQKYVGDVIIKYEMGLTQTLSKAGFVGKSVFTLEGQENTPINPPGFPITLMAQGCPLVKTKVFYEEGFNKEGFEETLSYVKRVNEELGRLICSELALDS